MRSLGRPRASAIGDRPFARASTGWIPLAVLVFACGQSAPVEPDDIATGPVPSVETSLGLGSAPVEGMVFLRPGPETEGWRYAVDVDEDSAADHEGILRREIGFRYVFSEPGVHALEVVLRGPGGPRTVRRFVVVQDPASVRELQSGGVAESAPGDAIFEGIEASPDGRHVYVADFRFGSLYRLDGTTLRRDGSPLPAGLGPEGLAILPSDDRMVVAHKRDGPWLVRIPDMDVITEPAGPPAFFVTPLDDRRIVVSGQTDAFLVDIEASEFTRAGVVGAWHHAVGPTGRIVLIQSAGGPFHEEVRALLVLSPIDLAVERRITLPASIFPRTVAHDPFEEKAHLVALDGEGEIYLVVDLVSGKIVRMMRVSETRSCFLCAANPAAVSATGRTIAFEVGAGTLFVDAGRDLPIAHLSSGGSVATAPDGETFFLLRRDGVVRRVEVEPLGSGTAE